MCLSKRCRFWLQGLFVYGCLCLSLSGEWLSGFSVWGSAGGCMCVFNWNCVCVCLWLQSAAAAPSPVLGNMPPGEGMPVGPVPPGFFQVHTHTHTHTHTCICCIAMESCDLNRLICHIYEVLKNASRLLTAYCAVLYIFSTMDGQVDDIALWELSYI